MTKDLRLKIYPAVIGVLGICLLVSLFANVQIEVNQGIPPTLPPESDGSPASSSPTSLPPANLPESSQAPIASPSSRPSVAAPELLTPLPAIGITAQGGFRVSNQTGYSLRVALLHQQTDAKTAFSQPVHWDFAPEEGSAKGLILSLPNQNLQLQPGDVLVAFAQDGSRRYWGPYVVGKTDSPGWNAEAREWQLILQP